MKTNVEIAEKLAENYPWNLAADVLGIDIHGSGVNSLFRIYIPGFLNAVNTLQTRQRTILVAHYQDGCTYKAISKMNSISLERINKIVSDSFEELASPKLKAQYMLVVESKLSETSLSQMKSRIDCLEAAVSQMKDLVDEEISNADKSSLDVSIEKLGLSIRITHSLRRSGYRTLEDLASANLTRYDLLSMRNIGEQSVDEITAVLAEYGICVF